MKKLISVLLASMMLVSALCITAGAKGSLIFRDDFNAGMSTKNWLRGSFNKFEYAIESDIGGDNPDNGVFYGYNDARVLQSNFQDTTNPKMWDKFYTKFDVKIYDVDAADMSAGAQNPTVGIWYRDVFEPGYNTPSGAATMTAGPTYHFQVDVINNTAVLMKDPYDFVYSDDSGSHQGHIDAATIAGPVNLADVGVDEIKFAQFEEDAKWFELGMRVTEGKIECYVDRHLVLESSADDSTSKVGDWSVDSVDATVGMYRSAILFEKGDLYAWMDNFEVWEPEYADDFVGIVFGDANGNGTVESDDVVCIMRHIAGWENFGEDFNAETYNVCGDVNADGKIDMYDATMILQSIAGWRIPLGEAVAEEPAESGVA